MVHFKSYQEICDNLNRYREDAANREKRSLMEKAKAHQDMADLLRETAEARRKEEREYPQMLESYRNDTLGTALKAIYITALEPATLTEEAIVVAENLVDQYIKDNGGAKRILSERNQKMYFLARLAQIVEENAQAEMYDYIHFDEILEGKVESKTGLTSLEETTIPKEPVYKDVDRMLTEGYDLDDILLEADDEEDDDDIDVDTDIDIDGDGEDDTGEDDENMDDDDKSADDNGDDSKEDEKKDDDEEDDDDTESSDDDDVAEDEVETDKDDNGKDDDDEDVEKVAKDVDLASQDDDEDEDDDDDGDGQDDDVEAAIGDEPLDSDGEDSDDDVDGAGESKGKLFDDLENEPDVKKAVEIIRKRIADAEETFIKNNAKDKKDINELLDRISSNLKAAEGADKDSKEAKIAEEHANQLHREINAIRENRELTVFEKMTRELNKGIVKDNTVLESYRDENGLFDEARVYETARVMYGFLETVNTLQLEKVDEEYIQNIFDNM